MEKKFLVVFMISLALLLVSPAGGGVDMALQKKEEHHDRSGQDRYFFFDMQKVTLGDIEADGFILDIGGGGEGVIGQLRGKQVIAIDISKRELEEAPPGPLKIVMDGRDLKFLDHSFNTATVFFTFMYIDPSDHPKVFKELHRVLSSGGRLLIWDVVFPKRTDPKKDRAAFPMLIKLPAKEIQTGYGVRWPKTGQGVAHYLQLAKATGFSVVAQKEDGNHFFLELKKSL